MHRISNARNFYTNGFYSLSSSSNLVKSKPIDQTCLFCNKILSEHGNKGNLFIRNQSTRTANALHKSTKKKVKYKNYKKYGEVMEVSDKTMTEAKVSISKLKASCLSKLASSSVSLGQLHKLTTKNNAETLLNVDKTLLKNIKDKDLKKNIKPISDVDADLLQSIKEKILKKTSTLDFDDTYTLVFSTNVIDDKIENKLKRLNEIRESYYHFRKATLYAQQLSTLRYAINEGLRQELEPLNPVSDECKLSSENNSTEPEKRHHAVFKEIFSQTPVNEIEIEIDPELASHVSNLNLCDVSVIDNMLEEIAHSDTCEGEEEIIHDSGKVHPYVKPLNIKKAKKEALQKKKAQREKRRAKKETIMKGDTTEMERLGKQEILQTKLFTHLKLLSSLDMLREGRKILQFYRMKYKNICDVRIYNTVLNGYAAKGSYNDVMEVLSNMNEDGIAMNIQTYVAVFECVQRSDLVDKERILRDLHVDMIQKGITLNDLMDKSEFLYDQRETVLQAIRIIDPAFNPVYTPPELNYACSLLNNLNFSQGKEGLRVSPAKGLFSVEELKERGKKQFEAEIRRNIEVQSINVKDDISDSIKLYRSKLSEIEKEWRNTVRASFLRNLNSLKHQSNASQNPITLYPYLKVLSTDEYVDLIISEIHKVVEGSQSYSPTLNLLQKDLGTEVYNRYQIVQCSKNGMLKKKQQLYDEYCEWYLNRQPLDQNNTPYNCRQAWQLLAHRNREGASLDIIEAPWQLDIRQSIGKFLYNIIIHDIKIDVNIFSKKVNIKPKMLPALYKVHRPWGRLVRLELKPHPVVSRLWTAAARPTLLMPASLMPLSSPTFPWTGPNDTPYLLTATPLVRLQMNLLQQNKRIEETPPQNLYPLFDSLNQLGEVLWVVNKPVLDLQLQMFRSGGNKKLEIAPPSWSLDTSEWEVAKDKGGAFRRRVAINRARSEMHSLWCDALYKLSLANHYRDTVFWLPHNIDFRGRAYACPPHLSQLGADPSRALLKFANTRPLGPRGLDWLKLHAINLTGTMKKNTLDERLAFANSIMDKIVDSADKPLDGEMWWMQSEEPWQTLACCMEIAQAIRSPNPENFESGFPVHQDGSCNGLQHYAALGGDSAGAAAVNLSPAPFPQDVYSAVAKGVEEMRVKDAAAGVVAAKALENFVRRKVIKQTVMTTVYGVTRYGARLQITKQLKDIEDFPKDQVWACSNYLTTKTFMSLGEMFTSTKLIQDWFTDCAKAISGVCGESIEWVTPLGLPVVQPYYTRNYDLNIRPCTVKQKNAFPPNFIHSLDSSHMMLTGVHCQAEGITFVSVHDCFWTHALTVDRMNQICRQQFVSLHSQPILNDLSDYLVQRYSYCDSEIEEESKLKAPKKQVNHILKKVPDKGDFKLENVLKSVYFFS